MKRIVICSDGTGNSAIKGRGTNVFKLFEAIDLNGHRFDRHVTPQIALYDDGVGTEDFKPLKILAGATGFGLARNVRQLYKELVRIYDPGDEIYAFGFSRGAFTIRTLVGLIARCGILDRTRFLTAAALEGGVRKAYRFHRRCYRPQFVRPDAEQDAKETQAFRQAHSLDDDVRIRFVGVWDTVDAVGLPFHAADLLNYVFRFKFPDCRLSEKVDRARHALAIDDARHSFHPLLWDETSETDARIEQVWFAGAHSNVGGGYPKQGMSLVALDWMLGEAEKAFRGQPGLRLHTDERRHYREHANVDDKLYDPRAGAGVFYRWKVRDIAAICKANGVHPKVHVSVLERIAHGTEDYAPGNLPLDAEVVSTEPAPGEDCSLLERRARNLEDVLSRSRQQTPLLARVTASLVAGRVSYYTYLATCTGLLLAAAGGNGPSILLQPAVLGQGIATLVLGLMNSPAPTVLGFVEQLTGNLGLAAWLLSGFLSAYLLEFAADRKTGRVFSQFWFEQQPALRDAFKRARQQTSERHREPFAIDEELNAEAFERELAEPINA